MIDPLSVETLDNQYPNADVSRANNWLQTPPAQMPWSIPLSNQPSIMRFTGESCSAVPNPMGYVNHGFDMVQGSKKNMAPVKRKIYEEDWLEMPPNKQLITEEKMAANLDSLHISNDYVAHQCGSVVSSELPGNSVQQGEESHMPTLVLCDELRRLTSEAVLPPTVMTNIERPTNALVLWQPPAGSLGARLQQIVEACRGSSPKNPQSTNSSFWNTFDNNNSLTTEDMNEQNFKNEKSSSENPVPEDSLMET